MTYFFDNNLSPKIVDILKVLGVSAIHLREEYPSDVQDQVWVPEVGAKGYVIITLDKQIRWRPPERKALELAQTVSFFVYGGFADLRIWAQVIWILKRWPQIEKIANKARPGTSYRVYAGTKVEPYG